jgi:hypothetical protein
MEVPPCPNEVEDKDLLEPDKLMAVANLQKYQNETRAWRVPKVNLREFSKGDLVLLRSPCTKRSSKLECKWDEPYVLVEKSRLGAHHHLDPQVKMLEHSWNADSLHHFFI